MKTISAALASLAVAGTSLTTAVSAPADELSSLAALASMHQADVTSRDIESDAADRIRFSDRLTMLSQRTAAASCALTSGVAPEEAFQHLEDAMYETDIILDALRNGNEALHILGPETDRRLIHDLEELGHEWAETHGAVEAVLRDGHDVDAAHVIDDHNLKLLELASVLRDDVLGAYSHPYEMTQSDALLIKIAGRQRMLTQKMAKDACEIWTGYHAEDGRKDLQETMGIFEASLTALLHGAPELGVVAAPTEAIKADLDALLARWAVLRGNLDLLLAGESLEMDQKVEIFHDFNVELAELEHLIADYRDYVERYH